MYKNPIKKPLTYANVIGQNNDDQIENQIEEEGSDQPTSFPTTDTNN